MRIGLTLYGGLDGRSGGFRYDRKLVEGLRRAGDTVEVLELPWRSYGRGLVESIWPPAWDRLRADVDVMLQDELAHPSLVGPNRRLPYPVVSVVHHLAASEPGRLSRLYGAIERRYLDTVDGAICNSTATRSVVTGHGAPRESTIVAPPAGDRFDPDVDRAEIRRRAERGPLCAVFVGNVARRKGLDTLIRGLAAADPAVELTVVGRATDEEYADTVRRQVRRLGLDDRVTMTGRLPDGALAARLRDAHVLAVPSRYEGFGIVYLEAMSFGLPVIASGAGGATDAVTDGETGFVVEPGDAAGVARALDALAGDRERLAEMGVAARRRYERHPGWTETTERVRRFLGRVVRRSEVGG